MLFIFTLSTKIGSCWEMLTSACNLFCSRLRIPHPPSSVSHWIQPETAITCAQGQKCWDHLILLIASLPYNFSHSCQGKNLGTQVEAEQLKLTGKLCQLSSANLFLLQKKSYSYQGQAKTDNFIERHLQRHMSQLTSCSFPKASIPIPQLGKNLFFCLTGKAKAKLRGSRAHEYHYSWCL